MHARRWRGNFECLRPLENVGCVAHRRAELAINARKCGALSEGQGGLSAEWHLREAEGEQRPWAMPPSSEAKKPLTSKAERQHGPAPKDALQEDIRIKDLPASSQPSCVVVKAAGLRSGAAADVYLRCVREAAMLEERNIARREVLTELAGEVAAEFPALLDADRLRRSRGRGGGPPGANDDVEKARFRGIGRFPALVLHRPGDPPAFRSAGARSRP